MEQVRVNNGHAWCTCLHCFAEVFVAIDDSIIIGDDATIDDVYTIAGNTQLQQIRGRYQILKTQLRK